jgi:hypothetical protein
MTSSRATIAVWTLGLALGAASARATEGLSLGARAGSPGFGIEATKSLTPHVNLRGNLNLFNFRYSPGFDANLSYRGVGADVHFEPELRLKSVGLLADLYPARDGFHFSGGLIYNRNTLHIDSTPQVAITVNDQTYSTDQLGTLLGTAQIGRRWAPYAGLGFGNPVGGNGRVTALFDLGVIFQGQPRLSLTTTGPVSNVPGLQDDLDVAAEKVNREHLDKGYLKYYPVLSLGIAVRVF